MSLLVEEHREILSKEDSPKMHHIEGTYVTAVGFKKETIESAERKIDAIKALTKKERSHIKKHIRSKLKIQKKRKPRTRLSVQVLRIRGRKQLVYRDLKGRFRKPPKK